MSENTLMNTEITEVTNPVEVMNPVEITNPVEMREILPAAEKPRRKKGWRTVALALCCSLIGGLAGAGGVAAYDGWFREDGGSTSGGAGTTRTAITQSKRDEPVRTGKSVRTRQLR